MANSRTKRRQASLGSLSDQKQLVCYNKNVFIDPYSVGVRALDEVFFQDLIILDDISSGIRSTIMDMSPLPELRIDNLYHVHKLTLIETAILSLLPVAALVGGFLLWKML